MCANHATYEIQKSSLDSETLLLLSPRAWPSQGENSPMLQRQVSNEDWEQIAMELRAEGALSLGGAPLSLSHHWC